MNVDIFGSDGKGATKTGDKNYVDLKFITLVKNLATKIDKSYADQVIENTRDEISALIDLKVDKVAARIDGDLNMTGHAIYNVKDPLSDKDAVTKGYLERIIAERENNTENKVSKDGDIMLGDLDMHGNRVTRLEDPIHNLNAANKQYVDEAIKRAINAERLKLFTLSTIGLIPHLFNNDDKTGYIVTTSSELNDNFAYKAFSPRMGQWRANNNGLTDFWIEIRCLIPVTIYMFTIKPADGTKLINWKIQAKNMITEWTDLPFRLDPIDRFEKYVINQVLAREYQYYRILVKEAESASNNPGLAHWQLFTINHIA